MADLAAIRNALAATIQANTTPQLTSFGYNQSQVNPPMCYVVPQPGQSIVFDTLDQGPVGVGGVTYHLRVVLVVSGVDDQSSQANLDAMLSTNEPGSVINAIMMNDRLGGAADFAVVTTSHGYGLRFIGDIQYLCADVLVSVAASIP